MMVCLIREGHCRLSSALKPFLQPTGKLKLSWHDRKHPEKQVLCTTGMKLINVAHCYFATIYTRYSSSQRAKIGKYACIHGVPAAARVYSRKLQKHISETTVRSIRDAFREESTKQRYLGVDEDIEIMPKKKRGRKGLLGEQLDQKLQQYLTTMETLFLLR